MFAETVEQLAGLLGVIPKTIHRWRRDGCPETLSVREVIAWATNDGRPWGRPCGASALFFRVRFLGGPCDGETALKPLTMDFERLAIPLEYLVSDEDQKSVEHVYRRNPHERPTEVSREFLFRHAGVREISSIEIDVIAEMRD